MFAMETYAAVRRFVFVEGKSRREAARVFGLSRDTIAKMCRYSAPPGYVRSKQPERPKLGPLVPVIDAILEADKTAPPKQRHTAKRIFERLRMEHGYAGGYTVVKDYVRIARTRSREVFVPLAHPPGVLVVNFIRLAQSRESGDAPSRGGYARTYLVGGYRALQMITSLS
jgi:transposase